VLQVELQFLANELETRTYLYIPSLDGILPVAVFSPQKCRSRRREPLHLLLSSQQEVRGGSQLVALNPVREGSVGPNHLRLVLDSYRCSVLSTNAAIAALVNLPRPVAEVLYASRLEQMLQTFLEFHVLQFLHEVPSDLQRVLGSLSVESALKYLKHPQEFEAFCRSKTEVEGIFRVQRDEMVCILETESGKAC